MMRIIAHRSFQLEGRHVPAGEPVEVSEAAGQLALRHGWAVVAPAASAPAKAPRKGTASEGK